MQPAVYHSGLLTRYCSCSTFYFFFFNDTATTEIYTLSLHDALPIWAPGDTVACTTLIGVWVTPGPRSEEHTSELQSHLNLVCRLLLEKKKYKHAPVATEQVQILLPQQYSSRIGE